MRLVWCGLLAIAGCFADPPDLVADGSTTAGAPECPVGSAGCPCTAGGACDAPLECHAESQHCYDPTCVLGDVQCPCADGLCFMGLQCLDDYCQPIGGGSSGTGSDDVASTDPTNPTDPTDPTTGSPTTVSPEDTGTWPTTDDGPTATTDETATGTTDSPPTCHECLEDVAYAQCMAYFGMCQAEPTCQDVATCVFAGGDVAECCMAVVAETLQWGAFTSCAIDYCNMLCAGTSLSC